MLSLHDLSVCRTATSQGAASERCRVLPCSMKPCAEGLWINAMRLQQVVILGGQAPGYDALIGYSSLKSIYANVL